MRRVGNIGRKRAGEEEPPLTMEHSYYTASPLISLVSSMGRLSSLICQTPPKTFRCKIFQGCLPRWSFLATCFLVELDGATCLLVLLAGASFGLDLPNTPNDDTVQHISGLSTSVEPPLQLKFFERQLSQSCLFWWSSFVC